MDGAWNRGWRLAAFGPALVFTLLAALSCSELGSWDRLKGNLLLRELEKTFSTRLAMTIDGAALSAPLRDFPVLVVLNNARSASYASLDPRHIYLVYIDELNTAFDLDYEIERWGPEQVPAEEFSYIWVRVPEILPGRLTTFWLYYNTVSPGHPQNPAGVWMAGYELVYHFGDEGVVRDSTGHGYTGIVRGSVLSPPPPGAVGTGFRLEDATPTYVDTPYMENLAAWTLETWVRGDAPPSAAVSSSAFTGPVVGRERYNVVWDHTNPGYRGTLYNIQGVKQLTASFGAPINGGVFYYLAGSYTVGTKDDLIRAYTGGVLQDQILVKKPALDPVTAPICLGCSDAGLQVLNGVVDEVRISAVTRSAEYLLYQYLSMTDSLLIYSPPEPV